MLVCPVLDAIHVCCLCLVAFSSLESACKRRCVGLLYSYTGSWGAVCLKTQIFETSPERAIFSKYRLSLLVSKHVMLVDLAED